MKILQISSAQAPGGGERHLADLANGLARHGHDVYAAIRPTSPLRSELSALPAENITSLPLRNALDAPSARDLSKLVRKNRIQIVHAHMARDYPLAAYAVRQNPEARLIITRHVLFSLNRLHRITLSQAARVIAVSGAVGSQLRADQTVPAEKISVVQNGIDIARFEDVRQRFDRQRFLRSWQLPENSMLVGTVGELTPLKGQEEFLQAALEVLKQYPNAHFIIAGMDSSPGNKNRLELERRIERSNLTGHVKLVGWLENVAELYCALDVFVSASHTESFGLVIAEAMASGTAVVATETEGAREIIRAGDTGLLVPIGAVENLAAAVSELLQDPIKRARMAAAAQVASAQFGVDRMIEETEKIYFEVLK